MLPSPLFFLHCSSRGAVDSRCETISISCTSGQHHDTEFGPRNNPQYFPSIFSNAPSAFLAMPEACQRLRGSHSSTFPSHITQARKCKRHVTSSEDSGIENDQNATKSRSKTIIKQKDGTQESKEKPTQLKAAVQRIALVDATSRGGPCVARTTGPDFVLYIALGSSTPKLKVRQRLELGNPPS